MNLCYRVSTLIENFDLQDVEHKWVHKADRFTFISVVYNRRTPLIKALAWTGMMMSQFKDYALLVVACAYSSEINVSVGSDGERWPWEQLYRF